MDKELLLKITVIVVLYIRFAIYLLLCPQYVNQSSTVQDSINWHGTMQFSHLLKQQDFTLRHQEHFL